MDGYHAFNPKGFRCTDSVHGRSVQHTDPSLQSDIVTEYQTVLTIIDNRDLQTTLSFANL